MTSSAVSIDTTDVDEARTRVAALFCPHRLDPIADDVSLRLRSRRFGGVGLVHLDYGGRVRIDPGALATFYLVQMPIAGTALITQGSESIVSDPLTASVLSPDEPVRMEWGHGNPQTLVYLQRSVVEQSLARLMDAPVRDPLAFRLAMGMHQPSVAGWARAVAYAREEATADGSLVGDPRFANRLQEMLVTQLLLSQPHNYSERLSKGTPVSGRTVRSACELIVAHHAEPLSIVDVAEAVGVSLRALQDGFRRELHTTPTTYLRDVRMQAVREQLLSADPARHTVTTVAGRHGFSHLGRFSVEYRKAFGEKPSETLAR